MDKKKKTVSKRRVALLQGLLLLGIVVLANIIGNYLYTTIDLTEEKRFTLTEPTKELLRSLDEVVTVRVLLDGEFPAGFKRLQRSVREILEDFRAETGYIEYTFEDPSSGTVEEVNELRANLAQRNIQPINLRTGSSDEVTEKLIYPYAIFYLGNRQAKVNFLEDESPGVNAEQTLNNSIRLLEYRFASALQKLQVEQRPNILFTTGKGELTELQTKDLERSLRPFYNTGRLDLDRVVRIPADTIELVVVARPRSAFPMKHKFILDQYVMNGGKIIWLLDRMAVHLDSLKGREFYVPRDYDLQLDDLLFKYGVRMNYDFVLDLECSRIPLVVGRVGNQAQQDLFPWYYHPVVAPKSDHPIVKGLDRINLFFPSTLDTVRTKTPVKKTVLLQSSKYSRLQLNQPRLNFEILRYEPDVSKFNKPNQTLAVLLEGEFPSLFENRVSKEMQDGLDQINVKFKAQSSPTAMMVVSDGDVAKNPVDPSSEAILPLGFNRYEKYTFSNKDFLINAVEYMLGDKGLIEPRAKQVKLRLLDKERAKKEKSTWQMINLGLPLVFLLLYGLIYRTWRQRRYAK